MRKRPVLVAPPPTLSVIVVTNPFRFDPHRARCLPRVGALCCLYIFLRRIRIDLNTQTVRFEAGLKKHGAGTETLILPVGPVSHGRTVVYISDVIMEIEQLLQQVGQTEQSENCCTNPSATEEETGYVPTATGEGPRFKVHRA
eukprot:757656-Hanusia_phi.AAC.4